MTTPRVISADCHVNEPPWVFDRVPAEYRGRTPQLMRGADGGDGWSFDGNPPKRTFGSEAMAGHAKDAYKSSGLTFDQILPGNYDPTAHVADMELDGVDVSIVYPNQAIFTYLEPDRGLAMACMRSYNDWVLDDFQAGGNGRIMALPMLPVDDGEAAVAAELERVVAKGAKAAFIPGLPVHPYHDPFHEPLWKLLTDAGLPATFHRTFGGRPPKAEDWDGSGDNLFAAAGTVYRFFSGIRPLTYMIFGGVFERHPGLKMVCAEVDFGWVPYWAQTMDTQFTNQTAMGTLNVTRKPSSFLGDQVFVTVLDDYVGFDMLKKGYKELADIAMFSTDYPHGVCLWPHTAEIAAKLTDGLDPVDATKILSGNAARVFGI